VPGGWAAGIGGSRALLGALAVSLTLLFAAVAPRPSAASFRASTSVTGTRFARLSNLRTETRWAYPDGEAVVRSGPSNHANAIGRLQFLTGDGQAEVYVALESATLRNGQEWIRIEYPARPNGETGWVPRHELESLNVVDGYLLIDQGDLRATLFRDGREIFSAPIGVGKSGTVTPSGQFYVMEKLVTAGASVYGPYALGTSAYAPTLSEWPGGGVVGIHGTDEPQLIPGRPSHGCIRLRNSDITRLWSLTSVGTPIDIT
jgi:hypothetical protein